MSIPFNDNLKWATYNSDPNWHRREVDSVPSSSMDYENQLKVTRVAEEILIHPPQQLAVRGVQFIRDIARLVLKVPVRSIWTPIILPKNWKQCERAKINTKLVGYAFVQLLSVPIKVLIALVVLAISMISRQKAERLHAKSERWTVCLDGRASQLEALKEEGLGNAPNRDEYNQYKNWLYSIDPQLCRKKG